MKAHRNMRSHFSIISQALLVLCGIALLAPRPAEAQDRVIDENGRAIGTLPGAPTLATMQQSTRSACEMMPEASYVKLAVYDVLGRKVRVLVEGAHEAGTHKVVFDASGLPSGTYFMRLETEAGVFTKSMLLLK